MSVITLAPPPSGSGHQAVSIGDHFPAVLLAARAGAEWAWASLHRCAAPPAIAYLHAGGCDDAAAVFGEIYVAFARQVRCFDGTESDYRMWIFKQAHQRIGEGLADSATAGLGSLSPLLQGPAVAATLEPRQVAAAVEASRRPVRAPRARRRRSPGRGATTARALPVPGLAGRLAALPAKALAASAMIIAATGGAMVADVIPQPAQPAVEAVGAHAGFELPARGAPPRQDLGRRSSRPAPQRPGLRARSGGDHTSSPTMLEDPAAAKAAGLAKAAAAPDRAGSRKDDGVANAAAAPSRGPSAGARSRQQQSRPPAPDDAQQGGGRGLEHRRTGVVAPPVSAGGVPRRQGPGSVLADD